MYILRVLFLYLEENYFSASLNAHYDNLPYTRTTTTLLMLVGGLSIGLLIASVVAVLQKKVMGKFIRRLLAAKAHSPESAKSLAELGLAKSSAVKHELSYLSVSRKLIATVYPSGAVKTYKEELAELFQNEESRGAVQADAGADAPAKEAAETSDEAPNEVAAEPSDGENAGTAEVVTAPAAQKTDDAPRKKPRSFREAMMGKRVKLPPLSFESCRFFIPEDLAIRAEFRFREKGSSWGFLALSVVLIIVFFFVALAAIPFFVQMLDATIGNIRGL